MASSTVVEFDPALVVSGAPIGILFPVTQGKKDFYRWYVGTINEVMPTKTDHIWASVKFNDGSDADKIWVLDPQYYDRADAIKDDVVVWRIYESLPPVDFEDLQPTPAKKRKGATAPQAPVPVTSQLTVERVQTMIKEALAPFENRLAQLEKTADQPQPLHRITGIITHEDMADFNKITPAQKAKYLGEGKWQGINCPLRQIKMCAGYKIQDADYACATRSWDAEERLFFSDPAAYVSWSWYGTDEVLQLTSKDAVSFLKDRSVCKGCANQYFGGTSDLHQIGERGKVCGICKCALVNIRKQAGVMPVCTECTRMMNAENYRERIVTRALRMLAFRFPATDITVRTKESGQGRFADFILVGNYFNANIVTSSSAGSSSSTPALSNKGKFYIVIERDQDQHRSYDKADENAKMVTQVAPRLRIESSRVFVIRYCPEGAYKDASGNSMGSDLPEGNRLVMLRNWVIWYITMLSNNSSALKRLLTLYLWYDLDNTSASALFESNTDGFGITDKAPKGTRADHEFSIEFTEVESETFSKSQMFVNPSQVFKSYTASASDKLSKDIRQAMS